MSTDILLTGDDVVRAGACAGGVGEWLERYAPTATALTAEQALALDPGNEHVMAAAGLAGYGDGDGYGYGYGYGDGSGSGSGYGSGSGSGYGYGSGYGDGDGSGYGYGYGYGDGDGDG